MAVKELNELLERLKKLEEEKARDGMYLFNTHQLSLIQPNPIYYWIWNII